MTVVVERKQLNAEIVLPKLAIFSYQCIVTSTFDLNIIRAHPLLMGSLCLKSVKGKAVMGLKHFTKPGIYRRTDRRIILTWRHDCSQNLFTARSQHGLPDQADMECTTEMTKVIINIYTVLLVRLLIRLNNPVSGSPLLTFLIWLDSFSQAVLKYPI